MSPIQVDKRQLDIHVWFLLPAPSMTALQAPYLELSLLVWPERLPLRGVEELVAVDVMQELTLQRHIDPNAER